MDKKERIEELVERLNRYSYEYYSLDKPSVTDKQYDAEYYELVDLEKETGYAQKPAHILKRQETKRLKERRTLF